MRVVGLIGMLITFAVVGALFVTQRKSQGPTSAAATQEEALARATAAAAIFSPIDQILQVDVAQAGTYAGAQLPAGSGVTVSQATSASYCLSANVNGTPMYERGPGGSPATGLC